nr:hypothetical protein [Tanacetum cinerariifolium]
MCDASDFAVGAVLGKRIDEKFKRIYYASKTLNNALEHYTTTKKELLVVVFFFDTASITGRKVYEAGFFWPSIFKDAKDYVMRCDACQRSRNISSRSEIPHKKYSVDYVSKWVEAQALPTNDARVVIKFLRRLFTRFGVPKALISDRAIANNHFMELNELTKLRDAAYENTRIYKERTKRWHDSKLRRDKNFKVETKYCYLTLDLGCIPGKLKSRWYGPNVVKIVYPYGTIEIIDRNEISFKVKGKG